MDKHSKGYVYGDKSSDHMSDTRRMGIPKPHFGEYGEKSGPMKEARNDKRGPPATTDGNFKGN